MLEIVQLNLSFLALYLWKYGSVFIFDLFLILLINNLSWIFVVFVNETQNLYLRVNIRDRVIAQSVSFLIYFGVFSSIILLIKLGTYSRSVIFGSVVLFFIIKTITSVLLNKVIGRYRMRGRFGVNVLLVGTGPIAQQIVATMNTNMDFGYNLVGVVDSEVRSPEFEDKYLGNIEQLERILAESETEVQEIIIALPTMGKDGIKEIIKTADYVGVRIKLVPDYYRLLQRNYRVEMFGSLPVINVRQIPLDKFSRYFSKRLFDVIFSSIVLLLIFPLILIVAILIKLDSKGPAFYVPKRMGKGGKEFSCYKFRTMCYNGHNAGNSSSTVKDDPRITRIGSFLRKYNIDELPQFWNVLKNEMSVVGPRPHRLNLNNEMQQLLERYMIRQYVQPGITGWAQVNGWRGPTETIQQKTERTKHDLWYIENWTFALDIRIIFMTIFSKKARMNAF